VAQQQDDPSDDSHIEIVWDWMPVLAGAACYLLIRLRDQSIPSFLDHEVDLGFALLPRTLALPPSPPLELDDEDPPRQLLWLADIWDQLEADRRAELAQATARGMLVCDGMLTMALRIGEDERPDRVRSAVQQRLATLLVARTALSLDLNGISSLTSDDDWELPASARLRRLRRRCRHLPDHPETLTACRLALERGTALERLVAARILGEEVLLAVASTLQPGTIPADLWLKVQRQLSQHLPLERVVGLLDSSFRTVPVSEVHATLAVLRAAEASIPTEMIQRVVEDFAEPQALPDLIALLRETGGGVGERALGSLLEKTYALSDYATQSIKYQMVQALEAMGTGAAVDTLQAYQRSHYISPRLWTAARDAVRRIRDQVETRGGQLALAADPEGGQLSYSDQGGELSLAERDAAAEPDREG